MIISSLEFEQYTASIKQILSDKGLELTIHNVDLLTEITDDRKRKAWYENNFVAFPLRTEPATENIVITTRFIQSYGIHLHYENNETPIQSLTQINEKIKSLDEEAIRVEIDDYIEERITNMLYCFSGALKDIKKSYVFAGIKDNVLIMKELLLFYENIRASKEIQLQYFVYLALPKRISDHMTDVLITILKDKLRIVGEVGL